MNVAPDSRFIGVDVGATKIAGGWVDRSGRVDGAITRQTESERIETYPIQIVRLARDLMDQAGEHPEAVGIGFPGQVDSGAGTGQTAINLGVVNAMMVKSSLLPSFTDACPEMVAATTGVAILGAAAVAARRLANMEIPSGLESESGERAPPPASARTWMK